MKERRPTRSFRSRCFVRAAVALLLVLLPTAAGPAQPPATAVPGELRSLLVVKADPEDFGEVSVGHTITRRIEFMNVLPVRATIAVGQKTCGCLATTFEPETVEPGERTVLAISATPGPGTGYHVHSVSFSVTWEQDGGQHSEHGICAIRFQPDVELVVRPEHGAVACVLGADAYLDIFVRYMQDEDRSPPAVHEPECTFPGWRARAIRNPLLKPGVVQVRASGTGLQAGFFEGEVRWRTDSETQSLVAVPVRLRVLEPWRSTPGGAVFLVGAGEPQQITLRLTPRAAKVAEPSLVELEAELPWLRLSLQDGRTVVADLAPQPGMPDHGTTYARLLDDHGATLMRFPVVWYTRSPPSERATAPARRE